MAFEQLNSVQTLLFSCSIIIHFYFCNSSIGPNFHKLCPKNPQGRRKRGRPRNSLRRDLEADSREMGYTWNGIERLAQDR